VVSSGICLSCWLPVCHRTESASEARGNAHLTGGVIDGGIAWDELLIEGGDEEAMSVMDYDSSLHKTGLGTGPAKGRLAALEGLNVTHHCRCPTPLGVVTLLSMKW
jgi:hypothetical protein